MSSASIDRKRARELVERIALENGFVSESVMESIPQDARLQIERALLAKDKKIGAAVLTLAKNLYTSNARFVFELLQNADDNRYEKLAAGIDPFVSFSLYSDRIIVECNEDGFTERNLQAICDVGNSSKSQSQAYIGEKGIGFKSVFMAAWKVHIQSGHLSFSFVHRKGDSGMGMVSPIWEEPTDEPTHSRTRITLFLHEDQDGGHIRRQFRKLTPALLLFVRRLRRIDISFHDEDGQQEWATRLTRRDAAEANRSILERRVSDTEDLDSVSPKTRIYHVTKHMATNIAKGENRTLSAKEEASRSYSQSEIVLAFPLTNESVPIIEAQRVFAFLPMGQMGFNFLIQADFVTQASREGVVTTSRRNQDLIKAVADAVIKAVGQFCLHPVLQYTWMRYLPRDGTHHWDSFWKDLVDSIKERLQDETVLRSRGRGELRRIQELKWRTQDTSDQHGNPLFRDLDCELYLSDSYTQGDVDILKCFGLRQLHFGLILETVRQDLLFFRGETSSRIRSELTDDNWHIRASSLLSAPFREKWKDAIPRVRGLNIIPLNDGSWVSAIGGEIIYSSIGDIPVPKDLGLRILADGPAKSAKRRELFNHLGVRIADAGRIRSLILQRYSQKDAQDFGLRASLQHLRFLYLTHKSRAIFEHPNISKLRIHTTTIGNSERPAAQDIYIQDDHPYGAHSLIGSAAPWSASPSFVHHAYFDCAPGTPRGMGMTWKEWMYEYLGVRRNLRLLSRDKKSISAACAYVAENRNQKLMGFLKHVWPEEGHLVAAATEDVRNELAGLAVLCTNGKMMPLRETYLPLEELREVQLRFAEGEHLPFLELPPSDDTDILSQWSFLTEILGAGSKNDLEFRLALLSVRQGSRVKTASTLLAVFKYIEAFCAGSPDPQTTRNRVYDYFQEHRCILAPWRCRGAVRWSWVSPRRCLWEAPAMMETVVSLKANFSKVLSVEKSDMDDLQPFFKGTLRVPDVSHTNIIEELTEIRLGDRTVIIESVRELYKLLQNMSQADPGISGYLRDLFDEGELICVDRRGSLTWHSPPQCLWSSSTCIEGKVAISDLYGEFEPLFREVLRVIPVDLNLLYGSLLEVPSNNTPIDKVKQLLLDFNSLLPSAKEPPAPGILTQRRIFPVRSPGGETALCSHEDEFVIVDREDLFSVFGDRVRYLDFSLKQVCRLRPFISWVGLEARYLSRRTQEVSRVVDGGVELPIADPDRDVRMKAYGLSRIAAKYNSPRFNADPQGLYDLLRNAVTVEAGRISSRLVMHQDGNTYEHEISKSELHLEEGDGSLKIYVPRDKDDQEICFLHSLPRRILSWIMEPLGGDDREVAALDHAAISVVNSILNCRVSAVSALLEKDGVPKITEVQEEQPPEAEHALTQLPATPTQGGHSLEPNPPSAAPSSTMSAATPEPLSSPWDYSDLGYATPLADAGEYSDDEAWPGARTPVHAGRPAIRDLETIQSGYKQLLGVVVALAQRMARHEDGPLDISPAFAGLSLADDVFTSASSGRDAFSYVKIGAAGELFPIRHHAAVHPRYADLPMFAGQETSDIVYDDVAGAFTELLIRKGHLSNAHWAGKTPKYYIEVKSTLAQCKTPLFVSNGQAARMLSSTNGPSGNENQDVVYAIFRVFNLGAEATGLKIYVDPEQQRRTGKLKFMADTYTVIPGLGD